MDDFYTIIYGKKKNQAAAQERSISEPRSANHEPYSAISTYGAYIRLAYVSGGQYHTILY